MKTLVWGFCGPIGFKIKAALDGHLDIPAYISNQQESIDIWRFLAGQTLPTVNRPTEAVKNFEQFFKCFFVTYQVMVTRRGLNYKDFHALINEFTEQYYFFYDLLTRDKIELVIFSNLPHEGPDYTLYNVSKQLGIKTLMCYQTLFGERFLVSTTLEDFGHFKNIPSLFPKDIDLEKNKAQGLFYMEEVALRQKALQTASRKEVAQAKLKLKLKQTFRFSAKAPKRFQRIFTTPWKTINRFIYQQEKSFNYKKNLKQCTLSSIELEQILNGDQKIAYFPMHLQPELTTSVLGGIFQDQLHAIETLRQLLGDNWAILVKENPKQTFFQRDNGFFERLAKIPNAFMVDPLYSSNDLMEQSELTATVSGTAGWEAIRDGKKSIVFGNAWYSNLKNCYYYPAKPDQENFCQFLQTAASSNEITESFEHLQSKMAVGITDSGYAVSIDNFISDTNAKNVVESLLQIITNEETRWS